MASIYSFIHILFLNTYHHFFWTCHHHIHAQKHVVFVKKIVIPAPIFFRHWAPYRKITNTRTDKFGMHAYTLPPIRSICTTNVIMVVCVIDHHHSKKKKKKHKNNNMKTLHETQNNGGDRKKEYGHHHHHHVMIIYMAY